MATGPVEVIDLQSETDRLYQLPAAQFTDARNALAARLKKAGRPADATTVKALSRPTVSAWALNQLAWQAPDVLERLRAAGDRLRHEQEQALMTGQRDLRTAMVERRAAVEAAVAAAVDALERDGASATPATRERLVASCEAIATFGTAPGRPDVGRLSQDVDAPGLAALASLAAAAQAGERARPALAAPPSMASTPAPVRAPRTTSTPEAQRDQASRSADRERAAAERKALAAARARVDEAEGLAEPTRRALAEATRARKAAQAAAEKAQREADAARVKYERALDRSSEADRALREAEREERVAAERRDTAEGGVRHAREALAALDRDATG